MNGNTHDEERQRYRYVPSGERSIGGGTIYDRENEDAWIRSSVVVPVAGTNQPEFTYDRDAGAYHVEYDPDEGGPLSSVIVGALADIGALDEAERSRATAQLESMAIDRLFAPDGDERRRREPVSLSLADYLVTISRRGRISIVPPARD